METRKTERKLDSVAGDLVLPCFFTFFYGFPAGGRDVGIEKFIETNDGHAIRNFFGDDGLGANGGAVADFNVPKNGGPGTEDDGVTDLRMSIPAFFPGPSQGHGVEDGTIRPDAGRLPDDDPGRVINQQATTELRGLEKT